MSTGPVAKTLWALSCASMRESKLDLLGKVPLFEGCTPKELEFLVGRTDEVDVEAGRTLIKEGDSGDTFYVLLNGEADVSVDGMHRATLGPGRFFGEISMLDRGPATATVVTRTHASLMVMSHAQFRDAVKGNDQLLLRVMSAAAEHLRHDAMERQT